MYSKIRSRKNKTSKKLGKKSQDRTSRHRVCITLVSGAILAAIFGPYEGKGLLEICSAKQTRKYDYMLNKVACKKENKTKSKLKTRDQTNRLHVCFKLES